MNFFSDTMHRMLSPESFFRGARIWVNCLYTIGILGLIVGSVWGLFFVPPEKFQGDSFRIMFLHVPAAHLSQIVYIASAVAGVGYIVWRTKMADIFMASVAPIGCITTALALISGIVWGKPTWGVWWVWDARTISVLILFFLFFGQIALRQAISRPERAAYAVSVLAIVGAINIPIIKYSVEWFQTLHQPASITLTEESAISMVFLIPLLINIASLYIYIAGVVLAWMRSRVLFRHQHTLWAQTWLGNK